MDGQNPEEEISQGIVQMIQRLGHTAEPEMSDSEQAARLAHPFLQHLKMLYWNKLQCAHLKGEYISCNFPDCTESLRVT